LGGGGTGPLLATPLVSGNLVYDEMNKIKVRLYMKLKQHYETERYRENVLGNETNVCQIIFGLKKYLCHIY
jgi:hypothetical protein